MAAKIVGAQESALLTVIEHPNVVKQTIKFAKELPGAFADRKLIHEAVGFLPTSKGSNVSVNLLNQVNQTSGSDDDEEDTFNTAFPSINQNLEAWGEKRRKLLEGGK